MHLPSTNSGVLISFHLSCKIGSPSRIQLHGVGNDGIPWQFCLYPAETPYILILEFSPKSCFIIHFGLGSSLVLHS